MEELRKIFPPTIKQRLLELESEKSKKSINMCLSCKERHCHSCEFKKPFYVSWISIECDRKIALNWIFGSREILDPQIRKKAYEGELIHLIILDYLLKNKIVEKIEARFETEVEGIMFSFRPDAIADDLIFDIKTVDSTANITSPRFKDFKQVNLYMFFLDYQFGEILYIPRNVFKNIEDAGFSNISEAIFKSLFDSKSYIIEANPSIAYRDVLRFKRIFEIIASNNLPEKGDERWCSRCEWKDFCQTI